MNHIARGNAHLVVVWLGMLVTYFSLASVVHGAYTIDELPGNEVVGDFVVGPTKMEFSIEPGQEQQMELMVSNRMGDRRQFNLEIEDATGSTDPAQAVVLLGDDRGPYSLKDYIKIPEMTFELGHNERAHIPVTISIPADAQPGGLYGSVLVTTTSLPGDKKDEGGAKAGSVIVSRIGALFFVTVPGDIAREGQLTKFATVPERKFFGSGPIKFQILFENKGSVHLNPSGEISIKNILGEEVGLIKSEPWFAFPKSIRMRELTWNRGYLFGYYTAELKLARGYDNAVDTAKTSFFVVPWIVIAGAFGALIVLFLLSRFIVRSFEIKRK